MYSQVPFTAFLGSCKCCVVEDDIVAVVSLNSCNSAAMLPLTADFYPKTPNGLRKPSLKYCKKADQLKLKSTLAFERRLASRLLVFTTS